MATCIDFLIINLKEGFIQAMKKLIAVLLCVMMVITMLASCSSIKGDNKGAVINMYLTHEIYDFDPVYAYKNDSALQLADLMFASLFYIDEKGNVKNELASEWLVDKEKNQVTITIADGAYWSDGIYVTANDFVYTIKRSPAASQVNSGSRILLMV